MNKNEKLLYALGDIDEKYIKEANSHLMTGSIIKIAACFAIILALGLFLFLPFVPPTSNLSAYEGSSYFPLIESIEEYRLSFKQPKYKNNFEEITAFFKDFKFGFTAMGPSGGANMDMAPGNSAPESNGSYVESTDNQVEGVIESDLFKMTNKYIFRLGYRFENKVLDSGKEIYVQQIPLLLVYSIDKENSKLLGQYKIPTFANEYFRDYSCGEMFLSLDGNTVTVIKNYTDDQTNKGKVGVVSLDVSDVSSISTKAMLSIDGNLNTTRMVDGKLLLVTEYYFNRNNVDYNDPSTFVPSIDSGKGAEPIEFEDIIFPETIGNTRYSVVALLDNENLELLGASALLNFVDEVYVSENNLYITREYSEKIDGDDGSYKTSVKSDIAVLNYSGEGLEKKGIIAVRGRAEDQYSLDEKDGYLRIVTTTNDGEGKTVGENASFRRKTNASLYIFSLADNSLAYKVEDFAPDGEEATAVRFRGDKLYVCTAVKVSFTDPVYFFDLSDYENITYTDTGIIEGYSEHLIDLGDGFLLGIGEENWKNSKVEIYEERGGSVVSVDEFKFEGNYSTDYKSYLVNRENNLFGFGVEYYIYVDEQTGKQKGGNFYILLQFNGYELTSRIIEVKDMRANTVRAAYVDGYLYITTPTDLTVEKIN